MSDNNVIHFSHEQIEHAFEKGAVLYNGNPERNYQFHAARKTASGEAEVHLHETDIFHIAEGAATLVTGGTVVDPRTTAPGEIRGTSISNGEKTRLTKGDVVIIPKGVPHWLTEVEGTFLYHVVKVR